MLIETQVTRSKPELPKEFQTIAVMKVAIYRNVDKNAEEQIAKDTVAEACVIILQS